MKKEIYLHVPEPCHENWEQMSRIEQGRFCKSCRKEVVDFSQMSDKQILDEISKSAGKTCGRFLSEQLERPIVHKTPPLIEPSKLFLSAFIPAFLLTAGNNAKAQVKGKVAVKPEVYETITTGMVMTAISKEVKITGKVTNEKGEPIGGASVGIKGFKQSTITNEQGNFSIPYPKEHAKVNLQVALVGYLAKEIAVRKGNTHNLLIAFTKKEMATVGEVVIVGSYTYKSKGDEDEQDLQSIITPNQAYNGIVVNDQEQPIPFASIRLNARKGIITDSSGRFTLKLRPNKKSIQLATSSVGYTPDTSTIQLNGKENETIKITLHNIGALEEVLVKCSTKESLTGIVGGLSVVRAVTVRDTVNTFIQKAFNNEMFKAYPNPATKGSEINLVFKKPGNYTIQLFDNNGRLYQSKEITIENARQTILLPLPSRMNSGVYFLKAINASINKQFIEKLIIQ